jgi:uncharacterized protein YjiS (DUF1127 family)
MNTTHGATGLGQATVAARPVSSLFERFWNAFQERRKREKLRVDLCDLSDRALVDIGITRGEIDYVAWNRSIDPRGVRSNPAVNV